MWRAERRINSSNLLSPDLVGLPCRGQEGHVQRNLVGLPASRGLRGRSEQANSKPRPTEGDIVFSFVLEERLRGGPGFSSRGATAVSSELDRLAKTETGWLSALSGDGLPGDWATIAVGGLSKGRSSTS